MEDPEKRQSARLTAGAAVAALLLTGCTGSDYGGKQTVGTLAGAGAGGLLGAQIGKGKGQLAATAAGTLLGAFLGSEVGKSLDRADQTYAGQAQYQALEYVPSGSHSTWQNPDSGHYGTVVPTRTYESASGSYCREFQHGATVGGRTEWIYGTACRAPDGQWRVVN
jgi:surface antigen